MERTPRRFWTFAVTAGAVLVILAAAASGVFQLVVQSVPGYRADVERYVQEATGQHVRISYATSMNELGRGLDRIHKFIAGLA